MKYKELLIPIYNYRVFVCVSTYAEAEKKLLDKFKVTSCLNECAGMCLPLILTKEDGSKYESIFLWLGDTSHNTIAHEVFHVTSEILRSRSTKLNNNTEETYAYLCGYITEKIYEII